MKKYFIFAFSLLLLSFSAQGQVSKAEKKELKKEKAERDYQKTKDLVSSEAFTFVAMQATPQGGQRFFINTTPNYIHIDQGEADVYLPYYGVVHASNGYSREAGIKFKGELKNYMADYDDEKYKIVISFEIHRGHERHDFSFYLSEDGETSLVVTSSRRNSIMYNGDIRELELPLTN